jgi:hypothetical protein
VTRVGGNTKLAARGHCRQKLELPFNTATMVLVSSKCSICIGSLSRSVENLLRFSIYTKFGSAKSAAIAAIAERT